METITPTTNKRFFQIAFRFPPPKRGRGDAESMFKSILFSTGLQPETRQFAIALKATSNEHVKVLPVATDCERDLVCL